VPQGSRYWQVIPLMSQERRLRQTSRYWQVIPLMSQERRLRQTSN
jgi:hypothetical protein